MTGMVVQPYWRAEDGPSRRVLRLVRPFGSRVVRTTWKVRVHDAHHVPESGPVILAANHVGFLDGPLVWAAVRRPVHAGHRPDPGRPPGGGHRRRQGVLGGARAWGRPGDLPGGHPRRRRLLEDQARGRLPGALHRRSHRSRRLSGHPSARASGGVGAQAANAARRRLRPSRTAGSDALAPASGRGPRAGTLVAEMADGPRWLRLREDGTGSPRACLAGRARTWPNRGE